MADDLVQVVSVKPKRLSFCITCKNRLGQLKETLQQNLRDNLPDKDDIEFVLLDCDTPGVREYVVQHCARELSEGYLRYFHTRAIQYWSAPLCKNTSHALARGQILVNLDVDNFTHARGGRFVLDVFDKYGPDILFHMRDPDKAPTSTYGRIALSRDAFLQLGGYDQQLLPVTFQDSDLMLRFTAKWPDRPLIEFAPDLQRKRYLAREAQLPPTPSSQPPQQTQPQGEKEQEQAQASHEQQPEAASGVTPASGAAAGAVVEVHRYRHRDKSNRIQLLFPPTGCPTFVQQTDADKMANIEPRYLQVRDQHQWNDTQFKEWMIRQNKRLSEQARRAGLLVANTTDGSAASPYLGVHPLHISEPMAPRRTFYLRLNGGVCARLHTLVAYAFVALRTDGQVFFEWNADDACPGKFEDHFRRLPRCTQLSKRDLHKRLPEILRRAQPRHCELQATIGGTEAVFLRGHMPWSTLAERYGLLSSRAAGLDAGAGAGDDTVRATLTWALVRLAPRLDKILTQFVAHHRLQGCVGVHVRRGAVVDTTTTSAGHNVSSGPTDGEYVELMQQRLAQTPSQRFLVATDHPETQGLLRRTFNDRVIVYQRMAQDRDEGPTALEHAVLDLFLLAECDGGDLIGTPGSSFSDMARLLRLGKRAQAQAHVDLIVRDEGAALAAAAGPLASDDRDEAKDAHGAHGAGARDDYDGTVASTQSKAAHRHHRQERLQQPLPLSLPPPPLQLQQQQRDDKSRKQQHATTTVAIPVQRRDNRSRKNQTRAAPAHAAPRRGHKRKYNGSASPDMDNNNSNSSSSDTERDPRGSASSSSTSTTRSAGTHLTTASSQGMVKKVTKRTTYYYTMDPSTALPFPPPTQHTPHAQREQRGQRGQTTQHAPRARGRAPSPTLNNGLARDAPRRRRQAYGHAHGRGHGHGAQGAQGGPEGNRRRRQSRRPPIML